MNRTLALLLTIAILLAHMLAIHKNALGAIAPPYDNAHVVYRIARNLVESQSFAWDHGSPAVESFPSLLWVTIAAIGTRLYFGVTMFCQTIGALSALITVFVLARFSPVRLAGVIAPLLFVVSGGIAAAAASGAETSSLALFVVAGESGASREEIAPRILEALRSRLSVYKCPRDIRVVDELPRTATGKVQRYKLRNQAEAT